MLFAENPNDLQRGQLEEPMRIIYLKFERTIVTQKAKKQKKLMNFYFLIICITKMGKMDEKIFRCANERKWTRIKLQNKWRKSEVKKKKTERVMFRWNWWDLEKEREVRSVKNKGQCMEWWTDMVEARAECRDRKIWRSITNGVYVNWFYWCCLSFFLFHTFSVFDFVFLTPFLSLHNVV